MKIYSKHNKGKSAVSERFIRALKNKIYKYKTSISKNEYIYKLDDIINEQRNMYHSTIKIKPTYVKSSTYIYFGVENNDKYPEFEHDGSVRVTKYKNIFVKVYPSSWSDEVFVIKKIKNTVPSTVYICHRKL